MLYYNRNLKKYARQLRTEMTDAENILWSQLKRKQLNNRQFYRQRTIGNYIVDFYCPSACLVIELDGGQHYENRGIQKDIVRDNYLKNQGLTVLRFSDIEVLCNLEAVLERIYDFL